MEKRQFEKRENLIYHVKLTLALKENKLTIHIRL